MYLLIYTYLVPSFFPLSKTSLRCFTLIHVLIVIYLLKFWMKKKRTTLICIIYLFSHCCIWIVFKSYVLHRLHFPLFSFSRMGQLTCRALSNPFTLLHLHCSYLSSRHLLAQFLKTWPWTPESRDYVFYLAVSLVLSPTLGKWEALKINLLDKCRAKTSLYK